MTRSREDRRGLFIPWQLDNISYDVSWTAAIMSQMAYLQNKPGMNTILKDWLGTDDVRWVQTPGNITTNLLYAPSPQGIAFAFSGTENLAQMGYYATGSLLSFRPSQFGGRIHSAFAAIFDNLLPLIDDILAATRYRDVPLTFVGHSLGGAIAHMFGLYYKRQPTYRNRVMNVITFGAPCIGGIEVAAQMAAEPFIPFRNWGDPVPGLPPSVVWMGGGLNQQVLVQSVSGPYSCIARQFILDDELTVRYGQGVAGNLDMPFIVAVVPQRVGSPQDGRALKWAMPMISPGAHVQLSRHAMSLYTDRMMRLGGLNTDRITDFTARQQIVALLRGAEQAAPINTMTKREVVDQLNYSHPDLPGITPPLPPGHMVEATTLVQNASATIEIATTHPNTWFENTTVVVPQRVFNDQLTEQVGEQKPGPLAEAVAATPRSWWLFQGKDRRLLKKLQLVFKLLEKRDAAALRGDMNAVSTHQPMIDLDDHESLDALTALNQRVAQLLQMEQQAH